MTQSMANDRQEAVRNLMIPKSNCDLVRFQRANSSATVLISFPFLGPFLMALTDLDLKSGIVYNFFYINS